jgi:hypothetical protein
VSDGLDELVDHVRRTSTAAIVVPDLDHLHQSACLTGADRLTASRFLRAPVLTVDLRPADLLRDYGAIAAQSVSGGASRPGGSKE